MEEIDHPSLGQEFGGDLLVDRLAGRQVTGGPGLAVPGIDVLVAVAPRVQRRAAGLVEDRIAVGVDAAAPVVFVELEIAFLGRLERRRRLDHAYLQIEAGLGRHRLQDLGHGAGLGAVADHEIDRKPARDAGLLHQGLGLGDVAFGEGEGLLVIRALRADPLIARHELAVEHHLVQGLAVDRELEGAAHAGILAQRVIGLGPVGDVDQNGKEAERHRLAELELGVVAHRLDVGCQYALHHVEAARPEIGQPHRAVDDRQVGDLVYEDMVLVPVVGELLDHDAVLRDPLDEPVGAGADGFQREPVARRLGRLGRHHHAGAVGELGEQRREGLLEVELDGERVGDLDALDGGELGLAERALHVEMPFEAVLGGFGIERLAVMEFHAGTQLDGDRLAVGRGLAAERQLRHDVRLLVDVEQLVADRGEDDSRGVEARQGGIHGVRVVAQPDAQMGLGAGGAGHQ